jgi:Ca-activated chloride channel family protein
MKRIVAILSWFCLLLVFAGGSPSCAQQPAGAIRVDVRLVEVNVSILDHKGHFVDGLRQESFQILEDGSPQRIEIFEDTNQSLSCAILLDTTGSMAEALPRVKNSIVKLLDELGPQDSVAVYTFDQQLAVRQDFTTDKLAAKRAILRTRAEGVTALFDALSQAAHELSKRPGKKALILFTDGEDNASALTASAAVSRAKKAGIPLYTIAEGDATRSPELKKLLDDLSQRTGGAAYEVRKPAEIEQVFHQISEDLRHLYMLSYRPPAGASDGKWRKIEVLLKDQRDLRIRAREGYFVE